jgi:hypothetical protein
VPTLVFSDGTLLTNPSAIAVKEKLSALLLLDQLHRLTSGNRDFQIKSNYEKVLKDGVPALDYLQALNTVRIFCYRPL